jgi:uncharacterized protein YigE (DUF2233 family)
MLAPLNQKAGTGNFYQTPNGVFFIDKLGARVLATEDYAAQKPRPRLATQSGPLLLLHGELTHSAVMSADSQSRKLRNGVCAATPDKPVFVISESPVTFYEFAMFFRDSLGCREALYLDGSLSSLYSKQLGREDVRRDLGPIIAVTLP